MGTEARCASALRRWRWVRRLVLGGAVVVPSLAIPAWADEPPKPLPASVATAADQRVVAYIHGNIAITRRDLGEFLIARGGMERIDFLVNKRVIEIEAAKRGISVTSIEIDAGFNEDLKGSGVATREQFIQVVETRYGKTPYEWEQDVIRPRLLLTKLCREQVKISEEELKKAFENRYGERRQAQVAVWPKGALDDAVKKTATEKPEEFDKLAAKQPNKELAEVSGRIKPVGRHLDGEDPRVLQALFEMKPGETRWVETEHSVTGIRCLAVVPSEEGVTLEKKRAEIEKDVYDRKLNEELAKVFLELKKVANPTLTQHVPSRPPADPNTPPAPRVEVADPNVLALIYGKIPVTRDDLGEFLIARGGYEKLDLLVNKMIIDREAASRGITVTPEEIEASKKDYVSKLGVNMHDFVKTILPKRGMSEWMWTEDIIKAELVMHKLCGDRVKVTEEDLQKAFEHEYGEKRQAKIILWGKDEFRLAQKQWDDARKSDAEFDRVARGQRDPNLASVAGAVAPIGRHVDAESPVVEQTVFSLQVGEVSQLIGTPAGILCVKCTGIIPPNKEVALDQVRARLQKEVYERKLAKEIPKYFAELKEKANPNVLLKGPPTPQETEEGLRELIKQAGGLSPMK